MFAPNSEMWDMFGPLERDAFHRVSFLGDDEFEYDPGRKYTILYGFVC
jgi:hypothetical protein